MRYTLIKFVTGEYLWFNNDYFDTNWVRSAGENWLQVTHTASKSISLEAAGDKVLYVRYNVTRHSDDENNETSEESEEA